MKNFQALAIRQGLSVSSVRLGLTVLGQAPFLWQDSIQLRSNFLIGNGLGNLSFWRKGRRILRSENSEGILTIFLQGDIDAQNAADIQQKIEAIMKSGEEAFNSQA